MSPYWNNHTSKHLHGINDFYRYPEQDLLRILLKEPVFTIDQTVRIQEHATALVAGVRQEKRSQISIENFLQIYDLSTQEGLSLMCLAEALLRIPDKATQTALIRDKIGAIQDCENKRKSQGFIAHLADFGLATTDCLLQWGLHKTGFLSALSGLSRRFTEPMIRSIIAQAMKMMGHQFVMGESIEAALARAKLDEKKGYRHSYDMLGEGAKTMDDAHRYFQSYLSAITAVGGAKNEGDIFGQPSISVKLSALHPRYEVFQSDRIFNELYPQIHGLAVAAKNAGIGLTIDAEESERLISSLQLIENLVKSPTLKDWDGLGLAVQAYQRRAPLVIDWLIALGKNHHRRLCVRLVKGAYWDSEIKKTQEKGLIDYPVFTRKSHTDVCYLVCAKKMLRAQSEIYPQFATHNAHTLASIIELSQEEKVHPDFEFQRLHGMGEGLYQSIVSPAIDHKAKKIPCRIYAPVGQHRDLLAYLVRRLLENGANSSFVNKIQDENTPISLLIRNPIDDTIAQNYSPHPKILAPREILMPQRLNAKSLDLSDPQTLDHVATKIHQFHEKFPLKATCLLGTEVTSRPLATPVISPEIISIKNPADGNVIGHLQQADEHDIKTALSVAEGAFPGWSQKSADDRAQILEKMADALEEKTTDFLAILMCEGGKTIVDALAEVREAIDFCRYYAQQARHHMGCPLPLPGPTGEVNELQLYGRGIFACISPWNFPLAIFLGQITAALAAGNCVIAKSAQQTALVAHRACQLAHTCGVPRGVLQYIPASGTMISKHLLIDPRISGVAFTGSTDVAWAINQTLSQRKTAIAPLIAETGGINAMIVDSSALPEQVVQDVITSAFQSAGQRCSALRLLFLQTDIADRTLEMLNGAMQELRIGNPSCFTTDVGPVIDFSTRDELQKQIHEMAIHGQKIIELPLTEDHEKGAYISPQIWELPDAQFLTTEIFGPILFVVRYHAADLPQIITHINQKGYGLTLGLHSRIDETIHYVRKHAHVGNLYVNRNMIGAVVGVQPFGGEGLSGTGPKAGGPHYLLRFTVERTFTRDTTAAGGNASLLASLD